MCDWNKYGSFRIDPCMVNIIQHLNSCIIDAKIIACCCGHDKYPQTIIIHNLKNNSIWESVSHTKLADSPRKSKRYYKRDKEGYFYIPEVMEKI